MANVAAERMDIDPEINMTSTNPLDSLVSSQPQAQPQRPAQPGQQMSNNPLDALVGAKPAPQTQAPAPTSKPGILSLAGDALEGAAESVPHAIESIPSVLSTFAGNPATGVSPAVAADLKNAQQRETQVGQDLKSGNKTAAAVHGFGMLPLGNQVSDIYDKYEHGDLPGAAKAVGDLVGQIVLMRLMPEADRVTPETLKTAADTTAEGAKQAAGRTAAFAKKPQTEETFRDSLAAVPTQMPLIRKALPTLKRDGIRPPMNIIKMSDVIDAQLGKLSQQYERVLPKVGQRQIPEDTVVNNLKKEQAQYKKGGVVSESNRTYYDRIQKEINTVRELAGQNRNGKLSFGDVRYLRDGMNGRVNWQSTEADENLYKQVGDVYRDALDKMAPETTQLNKDWATYSSLNSIAKKNMAMGRGVIRSGFSKAIKGGATRAVIGASAGQWGLHEPLIGALVGALAPELLDRLDTFRREVPARFKAARDYKPTAPVTERAAEEGEIPPERQLPRASYRMPGIPDDSGPIKNPPNPPGTVRGLLTRSPFDTEIPGVRGLLSGASQGVPEADRLGSRHGDAGPDNLVPVVNPHTGKVEYVPKWMTGR